MINKIDIILYLLSIIKFYIGIIITDLFNFLLMMNILSIYYIIIKVLNLSEDEKGSIIVILIFLYILISLVKNYRVFWNIKNNILFILKKFLLISPLIILPHIINVIFFKNILYQSLIFKINTVLIFFYTIIIKLMSIKKFNQLKNILDTKTLPINILLMAINFFFLYITY